MEPWVISLISAVVSGAMTVIGATYWFGRNNVTVADLNRVRDELTEELKAERRDIGEGLAALRQKIVDVEIDTARNYVRRESWHKSIEQLQEGFNREDISTQQWRSRIEEKMDRLSERISLISSLRRFDSQNRNGEQ